MIAWDHVTRSDVLRAPAGPVSGLRNELDRQRIHWDAGSLRLWMLQIEN
jgi:hypothetical protein